VARNGFPLKCLLEWTADYEVVVATWGNISLSLNATMSVPTFHNGRERRRQLMMRAPCTGQQRQSRGAVICCFKCREKNISASGPLTMGTVIN